MRPPLALRSQLVAAGRDLDPIHANDIRVDHEPQRELDVALEGSCCVLKKIAETTFTTFEYAYIIQLDY